MMEAMLSIARAIAYCPQGRTLLEKKEAQLLLGENVEDKMFIVDCSMLDSLSKSNRALWSKLLPPLAAAQGLRTSRPRVQGLNSSPAYAVLKRNPSINPHSRFNLSSNVVVRNCFPA